MTSWIIPIVVAIVGVMAIVIFNRLVSARQMASEAWSGIDVQLKRRAELVPNLVAIVKGYAGHERGLLEDITRLRGKAGSLAREDVAGRGLVEGTLTAALGRLMAGNELVTEGFRPGQVGSSAMPHKMNTRSCERVNGFAVLLRGYVTMTSDLAGAQWNEGDVSCSVVRRIALPDAFYAIDGLFETFLTVLADFGAFPAVIDAELRRHLPFLVTTKILLAAVKRGVGRETAHEVIRQHAVAAALRMREQGGANTLFDDLAADGRLRLSRDDLEALVVEQLDLTGAARDQVAAVARRVEGLVQADPEAATYAPGTVL